jgi:trehalose 6-phosphate phosphatase
VPLPTPATKAGIDGLRALTARPADALVGLDFDGTLSPIVTDPALARPAVGAVDVVRRLAGVVGTVAIVTGRPALTAAGLLGLDDDTPANLVVLGHYGLHRWTAADGLATASASHQAGVATVRAALPGVLAAAGALAGTTIEDKGDSVAVHVRRTADPVAALAVLDGPLRALAAAHGLRLEPGRMVLELRPPGVDKGVALESLASERAARVVCYAGDDLGDLAAFAALDRLRERGVPGLAICAGSAEVPELGARADLVVDGPIALVALLAAVADAAEAASA